MNSLMIDSYCNNLKYWDRLDSADSSTQRLLTLALKRYTIYFDIGSARFYEGPVDT